MSGFDIGIAIVVVIIVVGAMFIPHPPVQEP